MRRDEIINEHTHKVPDDQCAGGLAGLLATRDVYANFDAKAKNQIANCIATARQTGRNELVIKTKLLPRGEGEAFVSAGVVKINAQVRLLTEPFLGDSAIMVIAALCFFDQAGRNVHVRKGCVL